MLSRKRWKRERSRHASCFPPSHRLQFEGRSPWRGAGVTTKEKSMGLWEWVILLLVAGICGAVGQAIAGYSRGGLLVAIALGFIGALIGVSIARAAHMPEILPLQVGDTTFPIIWSIIGAALFVAVIGLL